MPNHAAPADSKLGGQLALGLAHGGAQDTKTVVARRRRQMLHEFCTEVRTANNSLRVLRRILNLAVEWGVLDATSKIKILSGESRRERIISPDEEATYLAARHRTSGLDRFDIGRHRDAPGRVIPALLG
jgi:hypothetical protein